MSRTLMLLGVILILCSIIPLINISTTSTHVPPLYLTASKSDNPPITFIIYLFKYDVVDFKYKFINVERWKVNITIVDLTSNKVWNFSDEGIVSQPITPIFRAPHTGLYLIKVKFYNISFIGTNYRILYHLTIGSSKINSRYQYLMSRLNIVLILGLTFISIGLVIRISKLPQFLQLVVFEMYGMWKTYLIIIFTLILLILRLSTISTLVRGPSPFMLDVSLGAYTVLCNSLFSGFTNTEVLWLLILIYGGVVSTSMFTYEFECKIWRDKLLYGISRRRLYFTKLISLILVILIPVTLPHLVILASISGDLWFSNPVIIISVLVYRLICDLVIVAIILSHILLPSIMLRRYTYALLLIIVTPYIVMAFKPELSILHYTFKKLLLPTDIAYSLLPYGFETTLLFYMTILFLSITIGFIVIRFRDYA